jgi:NADH dehydrogenase [ubiquinone] 1 alpha subcomplex assembly factor 6
MKTSGPIAYCAEQVARYDHDRHVLILLMPPARRPLLWVLHAFNLEIAKVREVSSQAMIGLMRLQWWRDAIERLFDGHPDAHQVIQALYATKPATWDKGLFHRLTEAREMDLEEEAPATVSRLWQYGVETTSPLLQLAGEEAARADIAGGCYAMVGLLRAVPFHAAQGKFYLPLDLLAQHGVSPDRLREGDKDRVLVPVVRELCAGIETRLQQLQTMERNSLSRLYVLLAQIHLKKLVACGYHIFDERVAAPDPLLALKLWWRK